MSRYSIFRKTRRKAASAAVLLAGAALVLGGCPLRFDVLNTLLAGAALSNGGQPGPQGPAGPSGQSGQGAPGAPGAVGAAGLAGEAGVDGINCWDLNGNGVNDPAEDINGDGVFDSNDCRPMLDFDRDGIDDSVDNCLGVRNADQADADGDTVGDRCDLCEGEDDLLDVNGDGISDCLLSASKIVIQDPPDVLDPNVLDPNDFDFDLTDGSGHVWDITNDGEVDDGSHPDFGTSDAFDDFVDLFIDGTEFPNQTHGSLEDEREVVLGPAEMSGLHVTRKIFVSPTKGFARWLDVLDNTSGADITVPVTVEGNLGSDEDNNLVAQTSKGASVLVGDDVWWVNCQDSGDPCVASFFCGASPSKDEDDLTYNHGGVTVPDGGRVIIVTFMAMASPDPNTAETESDSIQDLVTLM